MSKSIESKLEIVMFPSFAFGHMIPYMNLSNELAKRAEEVGGIKTLFYTVFSTAAASIPFVKSPDKTTFMASTAAELVKPQSDYPYTTVVLCESMRTCREIEGTFCDYIATHSEKPILYTGPVLSEPKNEPLEEHGLSNWLDEPGSVVFCAFGRQMILEKKQFQELVLGFELTELPFLLVVKPPQGTKDSQIGCVVKENHRKWKELVSSPGFMSNYVDNFHALLVENT
ncbi:hypothetical protein RDI58_011869 [Solanum bulbocastanum]|uniref:Uncharacterized protein n=1 Tax=Solanum bulbocastanum TaxID=147425 RepID=A0AAN8TY39_SOLBU